MPGVTRFAWRGTPIDDVEAWAAERGEAMIAYRASRTVPGLDGRLHVEEHAGEMPESFWSSLCIEGGWRYERIATRHTKGDR